MIAGLVMAREAAGISQSALAFAVGLKQPDVSKIENFERRLDFIEFLDIANFISTNGGDCRLVEKLIKKVSEL